MKVLHVPGGAEISILSRALRDQGVDASSCSFRSDNVYNYLADIRLNLDQYSSRQREQVRMDFFNEAVQSYDVFHFHYGKTFFSDKRDLPILTAKGKKMVAHHRGSEARILSTASSNNPYVRVKPSLWPEDAIRKHLETLSVHIDHAIVPDYELVENIQPYYKKIHIVPRAMDARKFMPMYPSADTTPLIVHAPTHPEIKGTAYVLDAINRLKKQGMKFKFRLIEKLPHTEALKLYQKSTIVIDQLLIGSYANLSMEAMAMGKPVICYIREDLRGKFPPELPIVSANPDTIYEVLKELLSQPKRWRKLGVQGRQYVEQYHSMEKAAKSLIHIYNQL